jgi:tetratricopeptide (TPR) repeat protein
MQVVLERHTLPLEELESGFTDFARAQAARFGGGLDWEKPPLELLRKEENDPAWRAWSEARPGNGWVRLREARRLVERKEWSSARAMLEELVAVCPDLVGGDGPWPLLARVVAEGRDPGREREVLKAWARRDDSALEPSVRLMELGAAEGDWSLVREQAERHLAVDPLVPLPYRHLARAAEALGDAGAAIGAYRALLLMDPVNPADYRFRLAQHLHAQGDPEAKRQLLQSLEEAPRQAEALSLLLRMQGG